MTVLSVRRHSKSILLVTSDRCGMFLHKLFLVDTSDSTSKEAGFFGNTAADSTFLQWWGDCKG
jgi:hypothetical protein